MPHDYLVSSFKMSAYDIWILRAILYKNKGWLQQPIAAKENLARSAVSRVSASVAMC